MKLSLKITLIVISCLLLIVVIMATVGSIFSNRINDTTKPCDELSEWMSYIVDDALLRQIAIPGSHDAGTAGMPWYSITQDRDIGDQLACGTRYFDLRVKVKDGECRIYHGPAYSLYLKDILADVRDFLEANPSECVILDVHKFGNDEAIDKTVAMLDEYLGDKFIQKQAGQSDLEFIETLTLGDTRGKCLLIWGYDDDYAKNDDRYFVRNDDKGDVNVGCLQSFYKSSWNSYYSSEKYIKKAIPAYIEMYKNSIGGLFVLQSQLTDGCFVFGPRYREGQHESNMNDCVIAFADSEYLEYVNIIMRDFVSPIKNTYTLTLNETKGLVKEEFKAQYGAMIAQTVNDYSVR